MARLDAERALLACMAPLLETKFFNVCPEHLGVILSTRNSGCNFFSTHSSGHALCSRCIPDHAGHQLT
jgi:hypothetical protein